MWNTSAESHFVRRCPTRINTACQISPGSSSTLRGHILPFIVRYRRTRAEVSHATGGLLFVFDIRDFFLTSITKFLSAAANRCDLQGDAGKRQITAYSTIPARRRRAMAAAFSLEILTMRLP